MLPDPESRPRVLGVYAHPDDEWFCNAGTFAKYASAGCEIMVVSATRGQAGQIRSANLATRRTLADVRELELRLACQRIGVNHVECWEYVDGMLAELDLEELKARVARTIRSYRPDVVFTFGPDGAYGHPDHIAISSAVTAACSRLGDSMYAPPSLNYAVFPPRRRLLQQHLVRWLTEDAPDFRGNPDFVHGLLLLAQEASTLRYVDDHHEVKWFPPGFHIVEQGEPASDLYLLLSGSANVVREDAKGRRNLVARLQPGQFFGEQGIALGKPRNAHIIATESATCLVLAPRRPTHFESRGQNARLVPLGLRAGSTGEDEHGAVRVDVGDFLHTKLDALAAYRSQFPLQVHMLPESLLVDLFGTEYFRPAPSVELWSAPSEHTSVLEQRISSIGQLGRTVADDGRK